VKYNLQQLSIGIGRSAVGKRYYIYIIVLVNVFDPFAFETVRATVYWPNEVNDTCGFWELALVPFINVKVFGLILQAHEVGVFID